MSSNRRPLSPSEGYGPTLNDPSNPIQKSEKANDQHVSQATQNLGAGPSLRNSGRSNSQNTLDHIENAQNDSDNDLVERKSTDVVHHPKLGHLREKLGLPELPPIIDEHHDEDLAAWMSFKYILREPFAEFFGTFILVLFGDGSVAQVLLTTGQAAAPGGNGFGNYQSINWGWGVGTMLGIYIAGDSGGFLNPAITFTFCIFRKLPWRRFPIYLVAQFLGGFLAAGVVYANYIEGIDKFEGGKGLRTVPPAANATAGIFCTYPQAFLSKTSQFFSEFITSAILMFVIFGMKDSSNPGAMGKSGAGPFFPLVLLFLIFGLGACFGWETGYAINLARDFGPRLFSYILGYGTEVWSAGDYYFWVPIVGSFTGCFFGALLYDAFIYTGPESPCNRPWFGLKDLGKWMMVWRRKRVGREKQHV